MATVDVVFTESVTMNSHVLFLLSWMAYSVLGQVNICLPYPEKELTLICEATKMTLSDWSLALQTNESARARNVWCISILLAMNVFSFTRETTDKQTREPETSDEGIQAGVLLSYAPGKPNF